MEDVSRMAFAISKLTEINLKRYDRYMAAAEKVRNAYRKTVLMNYAYHAQHLSAELARWLAGYQVNIHRKSDNIIKQSWDKVRSVFVSESENRIYDECESLEEEAMQGYHSAITLSFIPPKAMREVEQHVRHIQKIRENLKSMRNKEWQSGVM